MSNSNRVLRLPEVLTVCGLSRSSVYLKIQQGAFPPPIKLGARSVGWIEAVVPERSPEEIAAELEEKLTSLLGTPITLE